MMIVAFKNGEKIKITQEFANKLWKAWREGVIKGEFTGEDISVAVRIDEIQAIYSPENII